MRLHRHPASAWVDALRRIVRAMLGAPDYERYVAHLRARHPELAVPDRAAFERERLEARYNRPGSRCC